LEDKDYDILKVELYDNKDIVITLYTKNDFDLYKLKELVSKLRKNKK